MHASFSKTPHEPNNQSVPRSAHVEFDSWDVYDDGSRDNHSSGPANGATVDFFLSKGNGSVSTTSTSTGSSGDAGTGFTMGTEDCTVQAGVSYLTADHMYGTIDFTRDNYYFYEPGSSLSVSLSADDTTNTATATVTVTTWDVYTDGNGNYDNRNYSYNQPAGGAYVTFTPGGTVTVDTESSTTGSDGTATTGYACPPGGNGTITADASFMERAASDTVYITVPGDSGEPPTLTREGEEYVLVSETEKVSLTASGGRAPYPTDGGTYTAGEVNYIFTYSNLIGNTASGVSNPSPNLLLDRDVGGYTDVTVVLEQDWIATGACDGPPDKKTTQSPASSKKAVTVQKPTSVEQNGKGVRKDQGDEQGWEFTHDVKDQDGKNLKNGGQTVIENVAATSKVSYGQYATSFPKTYAGPLPGTVSKQGQFKDWIACKAVKLAGDFEVTLDEISVRVPAGGIIKIKMNAPGHTYKLQGTPSSPEAALAGTFNRTLTFLMEKQNDGNYTVQSITVGTP